MNRRGRLALGVVIALSLASSTRPASAQAAGAWLPAEAREAAAQQLAARVRQVDFGHEVDPQTVVEDARAAITAVLARLDAWGPAGVVEHAPAFPELAVPPHSDPRLAAMARYAVCTFHLGAIWNGESGDARGPERRVSAAFADIAIALTTGFLRHHFQALGGRDDALIAYLGSEEMEALSVSIREDGERMKHTSAQCAPVLTALLERDRAASD